MDFRILGDGDLAVLDRVADEVFDAPVDPRRWGEFLDDPRRHRTSRRSCLSMRLAWRRATSDAAPGAGCCSFSSTSPQSRLFRGLGPDR